MTSHITVASGRALLAAGLVLLLAACGGGGGGGGGGSSASTGGGAAARGSLVVDVTRVTIASPPVVEFRVEDSQGMAFSRLTAADVRFVIAQLNPGHGGEPSAWQNYINTLEGAGSVGPGSEDKVQGTTEPATSGAFVNHGDGSYTYTFATDVTNVTWPVAVTYRPTWTHRLGILIAGAADVTNAVYTWQPSTGATSGITSREIVKTENCNECHGQLSFHGGGRIDTRLCVTCHNPGSADANSGNTIDAKVLYHKLHSGANLPSVVAGGTYAIYLGETLREFSDLHFPQDRRNCTKCHDGAEPDTPQGDNWQNRPSAEACGSCHDNIDFSTGLSTIAGLADHPGGAADNSMCSDCHASTGVAGSVADAHVIPTHVSREHFAYTITGATYDAGTGRVTATFTITDPSNGDTPYDLTEADWATSTLRLNIAWDTDDYTNTGSGSGVAKAVQIAFLSGGALDATYHSYNAGTGEHTVVSDPLPAAAQAAGSGSVAIEGYPKADVDGVTVNTPITSAVAYFSITDTTTQSRRVVVDNAKCLQCHETLSLHGNNRVNETAICVTCHNPNNTDIEVRPTDGSAVDAKKEESIDFKRMIHAIHAGEAGEYEFRENGIVVYGHITSRSSAYNAVDFSHMRFPGILSNCTTCHDGDSYKLPLDPAVQPSTVDTNSLLTETKAGWTLQTWIPDTDPSDDLVITPTAAVCSSCHDSVASMTHMEEFGAGLRESGAELGTGVTRASVGGYVERCVNCHVEGQGADMDTVHGIE